MKTQHYLTTFTPVHTHQHKQPMNGTKTRQHNRSMVLWTENHTYLAVTITFIFRKYMNIHQHLSLRLKDVFLNDNWSFLKSE